MFKPVALLLLLLAGLVWQKAGGPDLTVRMRVGAAHGCALVLKDLYPGVGFAQLGNLFGPGVDHATDLLLGQLWQGLAVIR